MVASTVKENAWAVVHATQRFLNGYVELGHKFYDEKPVHFILFSFLLLVVAYILIFKRAYDPSKRGYGARAVSGLSEREKDELIADWTPEPLVTADADAETPHRFTISEFIPNTRNLVVKVAGDSKQKVTFCSQDFLGLGSVQEAHDVAVATLHEFSLGSCGPRGFYGTTSKHLELEDTLAHFMSTDESITYSDAAATVGSAIPAFAKRGDLLLVDAGVSSAVMTGVRLSRSKVVFFRHNDTVDLKRQLAFVRAQDKKRDDSLKQRRFIVVEGLYANYGDVCPLKSIVELAKEYKWRIMADDSFGFGVLGATGRGITEHCGVPIADVQVLTGSLATTLGSVGGFCVGSRQVVDHQRLSGAGYCFSASAPPFTCAVATHALHTMEKQPALLHQLRARSEELHKQLVKAIPGLQVVSDAISPVKHLQLAGKDRAPATTLLLASEAGAVISLDTAPPASKTLVAERKVEQALLTAIVDRACAGGVCLSTAHYLQAEFLAPRPTLKVCVTAAHTDAQIAQLVEVLAAAAAAVLADAGAHASGDSRADATDEQGEESAGRKDSAGGRRRK